MTESDMVSVGTAHGIATRLGANERMAAAVIDRDLVAFDCGGFGLGENQCAVVAESHRSAAAGATDRALFGCVLAAGHFAAAAIVARFLVDPAGAGFERRPVAVAAVSARASVL